MRKEFKRIMDKLKEIPTEGFVGTYGDHELVHSVIDSCNEIIEQVASESPDDWILCSDRPPEKFVNVLLQAKTNGRIYVGEYVGNGYKCVTARGSTVTGLKPIAWQPLPEGYKGE